MTAPSVVRYEDLAQLDWHGAYAASNPDDRPLILVDAHLLLAGTRSGIEIVYDIVNADKTLERAT